VANIGLMIAVALLVPGLHACTVMQLRQEVKTDEARLAGKEEELRAEEARQTQWKEETRRLEEELATREVSLDDLKTRLAKLQQANADTVALTGEERARKQQREKKIQSYQEDVAKIEHSSATLAEKQKKLEHLKEEIRKSLAILVHS
jgi:chromosome segregation ATPase